MGVSSAWLLHIHVTALTDAAGVRAGTDRVPVGVFKVEEEGDFDFRGSLWSGARMSP